MWWRLACCFVCSLNLTCNFITVVTSSSSIVFFKIHETAFGITLFSRLRQVADSDKNSAAYVHL